jgi:hypothetical protein
MAAESILVSVETLGIDVRRLLKAIDLMAHGSGEVSAREFAESFSDSMASSLPTAVSALPIPVEDP